MNRRGTLLALLLVAALLALPLVASRYVLSVLILVFYFAYVGQAWNLMMGYAGQLSLGHALYVGLGAYVAALLWLHVGLSPWIGVFAGIATAMLAAAVIGWLGFRFGIEGVYFALLTIAFSEIARVAFDLARTRRNKAGSACATRPSATTNSARAAPLSTPNCSRPTSRASALTSTA